MGEGVDGGWGGGWEGGGRKFKLVNLYETLK